MGASFAVGSIGFALAPLNTYAERVGSHRDAVTYFLGSILFTVGGLAQCALAWPERGRAGDGTWAWRTAWIQSVGTVLFNIMTFAGLQVDVSSPHYNALVWLPNVLGSVCFLISAWCLYMSSPRHGWRLERHHRDWWEPLVNGLGCVLFGVSAVAAFGDPSTHRLLSAETADWTTAAGALCFFTLGLVALRTGRSSKVPRLRQLRQFGRAVEHDVAEVAEVVEHEL